MKSSRYPSPQTASKPARFLTIGGILLSMLLSLSACELLDEPVEPYVQDCERYETAQITLINKSRRTTYDIVIDGSNVGSIGPGRSMSQTLAAGTHSLQFKFSNNGQLACSTAYPSLSMCSSNTYSCHVDL